MTFSTHWQASASSTPSSRRPYAPTAAFITGKSAVPAALAYVAAPATIGDGTTATVWLQRAGNGWEVFNVASGDVENQFAARVSSGYLLHEPQANAWYAVDGDTVKVLDGGVTTAAEGTSMTLEQYRAMLNERYGDKLPGSTYDRTGAAGGYGPAETPASELPVWLFACGAVLIAGAGAVAFRRLRKN